MPRGRTYKIPDGSANNRVADVKARWTPGVAKEVVQLRTIQSHQLKTILQIYSNKFPIILRRHAVLNDIQMHYCTPKKCHVASKEGLFNRVGLLSPRRAAIAILPVGTDAAGALAGLRGKDDLNGTSLTLNDAALSRQTSLPSILQGTYLLVQNKHNYSHLQPFPSQLFPKQNGF